MAGLGTADDEGDRQCLLNALQPDRAITRGREREARLALAAVLADTAQPATLRDMAYSFPHDRWNPWDRETEAWLAAYRSEQQR